MKKKKTRFQQINKELERFINNSKHNIDNWKNRLLKPVEHIRTLHERFKQLNVDDLRPVEFRNPYHVFLGWLLDVAVPGSIVAIIYVLTFNKSFITLIEATVVFGLLRWYVIDTLKEMREATR
jgi:hypothetical protein